MALTRNHVKLNRFEALESYDLTWLQNVTNKQQTLLRALESYDLKNGEYIQWKI